MSTHNSVSCGWWEKCVLVIDEVKICFALVEVVGEIVRFGIHYMLRKAERMREPLQWDLLTMGDITNFKRNLDF